MKPPPQAPFARGAPAAAFLSRRGPSTPAKGLCKTHGPAAPRAGTEHVKGRLFPTPRLRQNDCPDPRSVPRDPHTLHPTRAAGVSKRRWKQSRQKNKQMKYFHDVNGRAKRRTHRRERLTSKEKFSPSSQNVPSPNVFEPRLHVPSVFEKHRDSGYSLNLCVHPVCSQPISPHTHTGIVPLCDFYDSLETPDV